MRVDVWFASRHILADSLCFRECGQIFNKDDALTAFEDGKYDYMGAIEATSLQECKSLSPRPRQD